MAGIDKRGGGPVDPNRIGEKDEEYLKSLGISVKKYKPEFRPSRPTFLDCRGVSGPVGRISGETLLP